MMCQECGQRKANVQVTLIENGQKTELHLCQECAHKRGTLGPFGGPSITFHNILAGLFDPSNLVAGSQMQYKQTKRCANCGLAFSDFRRLGQLGCSECYTTFAAELMPMIRRIQGSTEYKGKVPSNGSAVNTQRQLGDLKKRLQEAIVQEAYEKAAELRDEIRRLEADKSVQ